MTGGSHDIGDKLFALGACSGIETQLLGDCGIVDCVAFWERRSRAAEELLTIRRELADFMISNSASIMWQDAFKACQEHGVREEPYSDGSGDQLAEKFGRATPERRGTKLDKIDAITTAEKPG